MRLITIFVLCSWLLTGCIINTNGMTRRAQIRADAAVDVANQERLAREAEAEAIVNAEIARQAGMKQRTATVMMFVPFIVLAVGIAGSAWLYIHWRGKITLAQVQQGGTPAQPVLPAEWQRAIAARGWEVVHNNGQWYPVVNGQVLPRAIDTRLLEVKR